jgi:selenoprotein W-related protein
LTARMLHEFEFQIAEWKVTPSRGGVFEVTIDGELVFSKKELGRHAEKGEIREIIAAKINLNKGD